MESSFNASLKKIGKFPLGIKSVWILPHGYFTQALYANIQDWLTHLKPRIDPIDSALADLLHALHKHKTALLLL